MSLNLLVIPGTKDDAYLMIWEIILVNLLKQIFLLRMNMICMERLLKFF